MTIIAGKALHDPQAVLDYRWDWSAWLAAGETVATYTVTVPTGIVLDSDELDGTATIVTAWISGGTLGDTYQIVCHITTDAGREDDRTITLRCQNR